MKRLIYINGTMGVGKTSTCKEAIVTLKEGSKLDFQ